MEYYRLTITIKKIPTKLYSDFEEDVEKKIEENESEKGLFRYKIAMVAAGWVLEDCEIVLAGDLERIKAVRDSIVSLAKPRYTGGLRKRYITKLSDIEKMEGESINLDSNL